MPRGNRLHWYRQVPYGPDRTVPGGTALPARPRSRPPRAQVARQPREAKPMPGPLAILAHTPWWAWALCALLVARGVPALRTRSVPVARILIVPAVFMAWGIASLAMRSTGSPELAVAWSACAVAGLAIGWQTTTLNGV